MRKNYTKPEIEVSRYDVADITMVAGVSSVYFNTDGVGENAVDTIKVVNYTDIFGVWSKSISWYIILIKRI